MTSDILKQQSDSEPAERFRGVWETLNYSRPVSELLNEIYHEAEPLKVAAEVERAVSVWACITAKSHREEKKAPGWYWEISQYQRLTEIKPVYDRIKGQAVPKNEGANIEQFTKRSRQRLLRKARTMNRESLNLPYFVTLTYHENYTDCMTAKKHLDNFLKRWRRNCESETGENRLKYLWKMEPQERGAVHFHIALFLPDDVTEKFTVKAKKANERLKPLREQIGRDWAEVTAEVYGNNIEFTEFDYLRKMKNKAEKYGGGTVQTKAANPQINTYLLPDWEQQQYGTNCREVDNWKMAIGYMAKYIGKEIRPGAFNPDNKSRFYDRRAFQKIGKKTALRVEYKSRLNGKRVTEPERYPIHETGRFWGFSNNFDFQPLFYGARAAGDSEKIQEYANEINDLAYESYLQQQRGNIIRERKKCKNREITRKQLQYKTEKIQEQVKKQARRHSINREKIILGYYIGLELEAETANAVMKANHFHLYRLEKFHKPDL